MKDHKNKKISEGNSLDKTSHAKGKHFVKHAPWELEVQTEGLDEMDSETSRKDSNNTLE